MIPRTLPYGAWERYDEVWSVVTALFDEASSLFFLSGFLMFAFLVFAYHGAKFIWRFYKGV